MIRVNRFARIALRIARATKNSRDFRERENGENKGESYQFLEILDFVLEVPPVKRPLS